MQLSQNLLYFQWNGPGTQYIDIAYAMSLVNRKLHRQQGLWTIGGCKYHNDTTAGEIQIAHAPKVWPVRNALVKMFEHWKDQQKRAYDAGAQSLKPKWQDFKVFLNDAHRQGNTLLPFDGGPYNNGVTATPASIVGAEWARSKIVWTEVDPTANAAGDEVILHEPQLVILGPDNYPQVAGIVWNYGESRALQESSGGEPELSTTFAETNIFTASSEAVDLSVKEITENLTDDNDAPPYDPDTYQGTANNFVNPVVGAFAQVGAGDIGRSMSLNGFSAPNGLLEIKAGAGDHHLLLYVVGREDY